MIRSSTSEDTTFPKATPIITPTAKSTILPRMAKVLNSLSTVFLLCSFDEGKTTAPGRFPNTAKPVCCGDYSRSRSERKTRRRPRAWDLTSRPSKDASLARPQDQERSEEHTSELQSLTNLVCRLLLEK